MDVGLIVSGHSVLDYEHQYGSRADAVVSLKNEQDTSALSPACSVQRRERCVPDQGRDADGNHQLKPGM